MSSAILYVAIVVIWALVLVPRWLHPRSSLHRPSATLRNEIPAPEGEENGERNEAPGAAEAPARKAAAAPPPVPAGMPAAERRKRMLQARRRTLGILVLLTVGAVVLAVAHLTAVWMIAPPALMLAGFLVLLREAALIDAERRRRSTLTQHSAASAGAEEPDRVTDAAARAGEASSGPVAPAAHAATPGPDARVIDISERIDGQFYDQYTDAVDRAVGD